MLHFEAAPPIPSDYRWLRVLVSDEIEQARARGYVADTVDPHELLRPGIDFSLETCPSNDIRDWRTRTYMVWFCYIYENFTKIRRPLYAIEEILLEFRVPSVIDLPDKRLGTLYAGAGSVGPLSDSEIKKYLQDLKPHYEKAIELLTKYRQHENGN